MVRHRYADAGPDGTASNGTIRCAVYTRKSTEEGLEQEFNSLDAQYEACAAYVASQRHEGWSLVRERYDDGGFSGGNIERPALQRLLADVAAGRVQIIILYKIDRLTRALSDFARIVEVLDQAGASFVSVTQSFNTTTSMGRLTLNMLLSFAQFEREVTAERIRDKIAASKARGMWMGGPVPLGYRVEDRKLRIDEVDAATVRHIFQRYRDLGSGQALLDELMEQGYRTRRLQLANGQVRGGVPFQRGSLFHLLGNRTYLGETVHKGAIYAGEHPAIIDRALWDAVQARIADNRVERTRGTNVRAPSLLAGIVEDGQGRRMTPSHAVRTGKRYRYYITHGSAVAEAEPAWRIAAHEVEAAVVEALRGLLRERATMLAFAATASGHANPDAGLVATTLAKAARIAERMGDPYHRRMTVIRLVTKVALGTDHVTIAIDSAALAGLLSLELESRRHEPISLIAPLVRPRIGKPTRLMIGHAQPQSNDALVTLLAEARAARAAVLARPSLPIRAIAEASGQCRHRLARLVRLSWLAPSLVEAIINGKQPHHLNARALLGTSLPLDWNEQRAALGFD